jgi:hypothetical protein
MGAIGYMWKNPTAMNLDPHIWCIVMRKITVNFFTSFDEESF